MTHIRPASRIELNPVEHGYSVRQGGLVIQRSLVKQGGLVVQDRPAIQGGLVTLAQPGWFR